MKLAVLNPGGNDPDQPFPDLAGPVDDRLHAPVNYHGYAACTGGSFLKRIASLPPSQREVLMLLRWDLGLCLKTLEALKARGHTVVVSLKESGLFQFSEMLRKPGRLELFQRICTLADGCLASTQELVPVYRAAGGRHVEFIPTPYPVDDPCWDFSVPVERRSGIFIGTREFEIPTRNHLAALMLARETGRPITVINVEGRSGRKRLAALNCPALRVIEGRLGYSRYLQLMAEHEVVFQLDHSTVPGQVAGDALLCGLPCVGGDGAVERLAYPELHGHGRSLEEIGASLQRVLSDATYRREMAERAQQLAMGELSFGSVAQRLAGFFEA